ncbi:MAG TPA: cytochrome b5-like heme/steroid binding domain-containing protein [Candidatus Babeliaceae bacterium]|nr:cytochrome b5-like heme/steroid binding domain-containing protein [Candidatus Babeliaceae bacterium]
MKRVIELFNPPKQDDVKPSNLAEFTVEDMSKFNEKNPKSCLVSIFGSVYDLNKFLEKHPGGARVIQRIGGDIIDDVFDDPTHSKIKNEVPAMLAKYKVGSLKS